MPSLQPRDGFLGATRLTTLAALVALLAACGGQIGDGPDGTAAANSNLLAECTQASVSAAAPPSAAAFLARAFVWVDNAVPYCECIIPQTSPYRADCSGFVSYAWGLPSPGDVTYSLAGGPWDNGHSQRISWDQLTIGDALNFPGNPNVGTGHVIMFAGWRDAAHTTFCAMEESHPGVPAQVDQHSIYEDGSGWGGDQTLGAIFLPIRLTGYTPTSNHLPLATAQGPVVRNANNTLEVFARGSDGAIYHQWQTTPGGHWSGWSSLGGTVPAGAAPVVSRSPNGTVELFVRGMDNAIHTRTRSGSGWGGWSSLGGLFSNNVAVAINVANQPELFGRGKDGMVWHDWRDATGHWSGWYSLGGSTPADASPSVGRAADGRLHVFIRGNDGALYHSAQNRAYQYTLWQSLGGHLVGDVTVVNDVADNLDVYAVASNATNWHIGSTPSGFAFWAPLGLSLVAGEAPSVTRNSDGRLEVFQRGLDQGIWHGWQNADLSWSGWMKMVGPTRALPASLANSDGRVELFVPRSDGPLLTSSQAMPGGLWTAFSNLGGVVTDL